MRILVKCGAHGFVRRIVDSAMAGLRRLGHEIVDDMACRVTAGDLVLTWGWRTAALQRVSGANVIVLEHGYIGDRHEHISVGLNGLNGHAQFPRFADDDGARFRAHGGVLKPWKAGGEYILLLGQVHRDQSLAGRDLRKWYAQTAERAAYLHGLPVLYRQHPKDKGHYVRVHGVTKQSRFGTLDEALAGAAMAITYNSNSAVDALMAGVPCYAGDRGTMAWDLCMHKLGEVRKPDRAPVMNAIAWTQWTDDELQSGEALRGVIDLLPEQYP